MNAMNSPVTVDHGEAQVCSGIYLIRSITHTNSLRILKDSLTNWIPSVTRMSKERPNRQRQCTPRETRREAVE